MDHICKDFIYISAHCKDCCNIEINGRDYDGYVPDFGFTGCSSDDLVINVCIVCGKIKGWISRDIKEMEKIVFEGEEDE